MGRAKGHGTPKTGGGGEGAEHKPGTTNNNDSAIDTTGHEIHPSYMEILDSEVNNPQNRFSRNLFISFLPPML